VGTHDAKARAEVRVVREFRGRALSLNGALVMLLAVSGCSESLFGVHGHPGDGTGGGDDDASVPDTCPASCIADAAANFDGTVNGTNGRWRYLGDTRNHMWTPMVPAATAMVGDANNRIERCADNASAAACQGLSNGLLITSSGTSSTSDPALEYTAPDARVIQLALAVNVPQGSGEHRVRLYRNSREDVLFTATASPGATVAHTVTVDALRDDRFLVALEPTGTKGGTSALRLFVIDTHTTFPSTCQLALTFSDASTTSATVDNLCGANFTYLNNTTPSPPLLVTGPFAYHGMGVYFEDPYYLAGSQPLGGGDRTVQFWVQEGTVATRAWVFSDIDETTGHGLGVAFTNMSGSKLEAAVVTSTSPLTYTSQPIDIPTPQAWHFVRVAHAGGAITLCLDGARVASGPLPGPTAPTRAPTLGRSTSSTDDLNGQVDDVRVFSGALPCD
jgi:hypothetical protein